MGWESFDVNMINLGLFIEVWNGGLACGASLYKVMGWEYLSVVTLYCQFSPFTLFSR